MDKEGDKMELKNTCQLKAGLEDEISRNFSNILALSKQHNRRLNTYPNTTSESYQEWTLKRINLKKNAKVLKYGTVGADCLTENTDLIDPTVDLHFVTASKINQRMISQQLKYNNYDYKVKQMDLLNLDYEAKQFDTVFIDLEFTLIQKGNQKQALTEVSRILKPGGGFYCLIHQNIDESELNKICYTFLETLDYKTKSESKLKEVDIQLFEQTKKELFKTVTYHNHKMTYEINEAHKLINLILSFSQLDEFISSVMRKGLLPSFIRHIKRYIEMYGVIKIDRCFTLVHGLK